ncbi:hypothetical protein [Tunturiibacter gelidoferens]|uniref:Alkyl hydroperoxide reductase subunit AhpF n=2 Tax=Tunturiibacter TaxID=3154218 RepID=A0A7Y9NK72_9BACT|nr:hypothetical protein [Edaphobacter lichenicola]MBB5339857.1 alkyl hydroperoxide reductase subunit AhpF [Edaphobacter lichenicola]NYF50823.1 alkyl hydroperoxide reductase subunit AhpF [Edaphobacter lichenicola]
MNLRSSQPAAEVLIVSAGPAGLAAAIKVSTSKITTPCSLPSILFQRLLEVHIDHRPASSRVLTNYLLPDYTC